MSIHVYNIYGIRHIPIFIKCFLLFFFFFFFFVFCCFFAILFFLTFLIFPLKHPIILHWASIPCTQHAHKFGWHRYGFQPQVTFKGQQKHSFCQSRKLLRELFCIVYFDSLLICVNPQWSLYSSFIQLFGFLIIFFFFSVVAPLRVVFFSLRCLI